MCVNNRCLSEGRRGEAHTRKKQKKKRGVNGGFCGTKTARRVSSSNNQERGEKKARERSEAEGTTRAGVADKRAAFVSLQLFSIQNTSTGLVQTGSGGGGCQQGECGW